MSGEPWLRDRMNDRSVMTEPPGVLRLAEQQLGLMSDRQLADLGVPRKFWSRVVGRSQWEPMSSRVWRRAGAPCHDLTCAMAAVLHFGPGAAISHHSAAFLWGVPGFRLWPLQVSVPRPAWGGSDALHLRLPEQILRRQRAEDYRVIVHRPKGWPERAVGAIDGIDVVRPALLLLQLAPGVAPQRLQRILDNLWSRQLLSGPSVAADLKPIMGRGRAGVVAVRTLLDRCGPDYVPPDSNLESRLIDIVETAGMPPLVRQRNLGDNERWLGRVDLYWPQWLIIIEVDSDKYHSALSDREYDGARQRALEATGYTVVRITEFELWHRRDVVIARLRSAIASAQARSAA